MPLDVNHYVVRLDRETADCMIEAAAFSLAAKFLAEIMKHNKCILR